MINLDHSAISSLKRLEKFVAIMWVYIRRPGLNIISHPNSIFHYVIHYRIDWVSDEAMLWE